MTVPRPHCIIYIIYYVLLSVDFCVQGYINKLLVAAISLNNMSLQFYRIHQLQNKTKKTKERTQKKGLKMGNDNQTILKNKNKKKKEENISFIFIY